MKQVKGERRKAKGERAKGVSRFVFLARGLPFVLALLLWLAALFAPTFAAIRGTPPALPERFSGLERIELGWNDIKRQEKDNTCGLAVLSLLLAWAGVDISEAALAKQVTLTPQGISLFDWQELAKKHGIQGTWFRVASQSLSEMPLPLVAQIKDQNGHFVLVQRVYNGYVLLSDPNVGLVLYSLPEFLRVWTGRSFVLKGI
jgi:hypothetical protein